MALELYDTALNEIGDIRTSLYDLFFDLIEEKNPFSQIVPQTLNSTPKSNRNKLEKTKQDVIILIEESEEDDSTIQSRTEVSIRTESSHQKDSGSSNKNVTPIRQKDMNKKNLSLISKTHSVLKPGKKLMYTISPRKDLHKKKAIEKADIRLTRSKTAPRRSTRRLEGVSTSNKK